MLKILQVARQDYCTTKIIPSRMIVVFDERVSDIELLRQALLPGVVSSTINAEADAVVAISQLLATTGAKSLAIVAHGQPGVIHLGKTPLDMQQLQSQSQLLQQWNVQEISLYSCEVGQGNVGQNLIYQLSELTGAKVSAAKHKVGNTELGGSWDLAVSTGEIRTPIFFAASMLETYQGILPANDFLPKTDFPIGNIPTDVTVGDFNGDGKLDLVTTALGSLNPITNVYRGEISVSLGNGIGGFGPGISFTNTGAPLSVAVGDFNGDGKLDLVTTNNYTNRVSVFLGNGAGGFSPRTEFAVGTSPKSVTVGDFNGDGKLDLATANEDSNNVSVLLGNGSGGFGTKTDFAVGTSPNSVTVGDFNGDGKLDLAATNRVGNNISVLLGNGAGSFGLKTDFAVGTSPNSVTVGDFNRDGNLDLAAANAGSRTVSVLLGNGDGSFGTKTDFATGFVPSVKAADFNSDGNLDLVFTGVNNGTVSVLPGNGDGSFGAKTDFLAGGGKIAVGDFNGDSKPDLAVTSSSVVSVLLNNFAPSSSRRNDFNGDSKSDILWRNNDGRVALWQMNGPTVTIGSVFATVSTDWKISSTGDFNGDNKSDILWRNDNGQVALWTMDGATKTSGTVLATVSTDRKIASTADFGGDQKADILWRNDDGRMAIWQMDGATQLASAVVATVSTDWKIAGTGDFNGDNKSDILWRKNDGQVALWQMDGLNILSQNYLNPYPTVDNSWKIAGTGDFNGDGKSDILWRNDDGSTNIWLMNGANVLSFGPVPQYPTVDNSWKISGTGDFNGDGKADILWRNTNGSTNIWEMNGLNVITNNSTNPYSITDNTWNIAASIL